MSHISLGFGSVVQVVHVSPDMRKAYIGSSSDLTANGKSIMAFNKSWRSLPIQSWSGGLKIAGLPSLTAMTCVSIIPLGEGGRGVHVMTAAATNCAHICLHLFLQVFRLAASVTNSRFVQ